MKLILSMPMSERWKARLNLIVGPCLVAAVIAAISVEAQTPSVLFDVNGNVAVKNDVVYLQTTMPLNVTELYHLQDASTTRRGILMSTSSEFGGDGKVEIRVFDYDQQNQRKGALIYATYGDARGWNENSWDGGGSLFTEDAQFSETLGLLFDIGKIKSTDIKVLSQMEGLDFVCQPTSNSARPGKSYIAEALMGSLLPIPVDDNQNRVTRQPGARSFADVARIAWIQTTNSIDAMREKIEEDRLHLYDVWNIKTVVHKDYRAVAYNRNVAAGNLQSATFAHQALRSRYSDAVANVGATQAALTTAQARLNDPGALASEAQLAMDAALAACIKRNEEVKKAKDYASAKSAKAAEAAGLVAAARRAVEDCRPAVPSRRAALERAEAALSRARAAVALGNELSEAFLYPLRVAKVNLWAVENDFDHAKDGVISAKAALSAIDADYAPAAYAQAQHNYAAAQDDFDWMVEVYVDMRTSYKQVKSGFVNAQIAQQKAGDDLTQAKKSYELADIEFGSALGTLRLRTEYLGRTVADSTYRAVVAHYAEAASRTARVRLTEAVMLRDALRARTNDPAALLRYNVEYMQTMHDNAQADVTELADRVNAAAREVERLKREDEEADKKLEAMVPIMMRAMADVDDAKKKLDDDDDEAGAAGAVAQVAQLAVDPELYPYSILTPLAIYGYPYLLNDALDAELFHNADLSDKAQDDFLLLCENYAADAGINWCDMVSPMPVVLVEVAIKNSKVYAIKIPGLPGLKPAQFTSKSPAYDTDAAAQVVSVANGAQFQTLASAYEIEETPYTTQVDLTDFPKYDHLIVPDFTAGSKNNIEQEFKMDNWNRLPLVADAEKFNEMRKQLDSVAEVLAVSPEDYYSLTELTHDYMTAKNQTSQETTQFALATLTINSDHGNKISLTVGASGPFEVNNGLASKTQLPANNEIFTRQAVATPSEVPTEEFEGGTIKLYPNPTQGVVTIEFNLPEPSPVEVKIFNAVGDVVYDDKTYSAAGLQSMIVDVKKTSGPGIIFVSITTSRGQRLVKLLVK